MIARKYQHIAHYIENGVEAIRRTGIRVLALQDRYVKLLMPLAGNTNHIGIMYAGSLFALGEVTGGAIFAVAFDTEHYVPIVKEVTIRYRRPALTDITLESAIPADRVAAVETDLREKGKADFPLTVELKDAGGEVVSLVQGVWQARKMPEGLVNPLAKP